VSALFSITAGWTGLLGPFTLRVDGAELDLSGMTVTPIIRRGSGALVTAGGVVTVLNQVTNKGQVTYAPVGTDFTWEDARYTINQTYQLRWKVVDGAQKTVYFPNGEPAEIAVYRA
jgi:hypothetical protein